MKKKFLAMLLIFSMFVSIFSPMTVALAENAVPEFAGTDIPASFSGAVLRYEASGADQVKVHIGWRNTPRVNTIGLSFSFDTNILTLNGTNAAKSTEWYDLDNEIFAPKGDFEGATWDIVGATARGSRSDGYYTLDYVVDPVTMNPAIESGDLKGFELNNGSLVLNLDKVAKDQLIDICTVTFKLQAGKTFDDIKADTFTLHDDKVYAPDGLILIDITGDTPVGNVFWQNFPNKRIDPTYTATLKVQDATSKAGIVGANVEISGGSLTAAASQATGSDGTVVFSDLKDGTYAYTISHTDYATATGSITINGGNLAQNIDMAPASADGAPSEIVGTDIPASFSGAVLRYEASGADQVKVHIGWRNTPRVNTIGLSFSFDTNVLTLNGTNAAKSTEWYELDNDIFAPKGDFEGATWDIVGATARGSRSEGFYTLDYVVDPVTMNPAIESGNLKGFELNDGSLVLNLDKVAKDQLIDVCTVTFKLQAGKTFDDIKASTFALHDDDIYAPDGLILIDITGDTPVGSVLWQNFPGKADASLPSYTATLKVQDATSKAGIVGANVEISGGSLTSATSQTTGSNGTVVFSDLKDGTYAYTISHADYSTTTGAFTVSGTNLTQNIDMTVKPAATYDATFTVQEGAVNLSGATITVFKNGTAVGSSVTTNTSGKATVSGLTAGNYTFTVAKSGYQSKEDGSFTITNSNYAVPVVKLVKSSAPTFPVTIPVKDKATGTAIEGATVTVTSSNGAKAAVATAVTGANGNATVQLEAGSYNFGVTKAGYIKMDNGTLTVGSAGAVTLNPTEVQMDPIPVTGNPVYRITGKASDDGNQYTLEVRLANTTAYQGSLGIKFDDTVFQLNSFTLIDQLEAIKFAEDKDYDYLQSEKDYHTVYWKTKEESPKLDASSSEGTLIATYVFDRIAWPDADSTDLSKYVDNESFVLQDFSTTKMGEKLADNTALLNEVWQDGKYQIMREDLANGIAEVVPVEMEFSYAEQSLARVNFQAVEKNKDGSLVVPEKAIEAVMVSIYGADGTTLVGTTVTNAQGFARASLNANAAYKYIFEDATNDIYWPAPGDDTNPKLQGDIASADITNEQGLGKTKDIKEGMLAKEKHNISWDLTNGDDSNPDGKINGEAQYTDPNGTLNQDYKFMVEPAPGKQINGTPQYIVTPDGGVAEAPKNAEFDPIENKWYIPGADITGPVEITVDFQDRTYTVKATAGEGGKVTRSNGETAAAGTLTQDNIPAYGNSDTFTFTPEDGYIIDQIAINGSVLEGVTGKTTYDYIFENVVDDGNIVVTFCPQPVNPDEAPTPTHRIFTFNSGINGTVEVTVTGQGAEQFTVAGGTQDVRILPIGAQVAVVAKGNIDAPGFVIDQFEKDKVVVDEAAGEAVYTVNQTVDGDNHNVTVSFKADTEDAKTIQYHVITKIAGGNGTIVPIGDRLYNAGTSFDVVMTPAQYWAIEEITINDTQLGAQTDAYTYTIDDLQKDETIIVTFAAKLETVNGYVKISSESADATGAWVEFSKEVDGKTEVYTLMDDNGQKKSDNPQALADDSGKTNGYSAFTINLPVGVYTLTVHKEGYVDYVITDFVVEENTNVAIEKAIPIKPGDASWDRVLISLIDAATISGGFAGDGSMATQGNISEGTAGPSVDDMFFVKQNYGDTKSTISWDEYKALPADKPGN